jgi:hypothetical protein
VVISCVDEKDTRRSTFKHLVVVVGLTISGESIHQSPFPFSLSLIRQTVDDIYSQPVPHYKSIMDETYGIVLIVLAAVASAIVVLMVFAKLWGKAAYEKILQTPKTACDIDAFVGSKYPCKYFKVAAAHRLRLGWRVPNTTTPIPLECTESPHVPGLFVSRNVHPQNSSSNSGGSTEKVTPLIDLLPRVTNDGKLDKRSNKKSLVVATIRMGFGHHRLAYSICSWAVQEGYNTIFHDMLNIKSEEQALIQELDALYSKFSRLASELGGPIEMLWGKAMKQGDADALRVAALAAAHLQPLLLAYPKDIPMITTHQLVALTASAAGFTNVVNLVVDNFPQWFLVVPKTLNLVQGPVNYQSFLKMGVKPSELKWAGHWNPVELVANIDADCNRRIARCNVGLENGVDAAINIKPRRLLIPVGGAGAQRKFIIHLLAALKDLVEQNKIQLFLNAGDHKHMKTAFEQVLKETDMPYDTVTTTAGVYEFQKKLLDPTKEPNKAITLFAFDEYFPAVATTDILCRVSDVLTCKPSELAFYPIPKLHIRRVGDHEADSARRAGELGDGTLEAREVQDAMEYVDLMLTSPDLLVGMNTCIMQNNKIHLYDGCKKAVELAVAHTE